MLLGLLVAAHLANRLLARGAEPMLLPLAAVLNGIGFVMITRLSDRLAGLQATWTFVAIGAYVTTLLVVQRVGDLARYRWTFFFGGTFLLLLPLVPGIGFASGGARIWVSVGPINFQPGEFAKLALALFFASYLAERRELIAAGTWRVGPLNLPEPAHLLPILLAWGFSVVVMVFQRDLGSSLLFFSLFVVMLWVATEKASYLVIGFGLFMAGATFAYQMFDHVQDRVADLARPLGRLREQGLPAGAGCIRLWAGAARWHRPRTR
jgi:cell division protein FtsW (lipid II flippase)